MAESEGCVMAIIERKASYGVKIHLGHNEYEWVGSFRFIDYGGKRAAKQAAVDAASEALKQLTGRRRTPETWGEFAKRWPEDYPRESGTTKRSYEYGVKPFSEEFGDVRMGDTASQHVYERMRKWARKQPKSQVAVLRNMVNDAREDRLTNANPFEKLWTNRRSERSTVRGGKKKIWVPTTEQLEQLADLAVEIHGDEYGPTFRAYILFQAYSMLRPAETAVLQESKIDFDKQEIEVSWQLNGLGEIVPHTKNGQQKTVALLARAAKALREKPQQLSVRGPDDRPLLFVGPDGALLGKGARHNLWNPVRAAFGRPKMRLYDLKHFGATYLQELGGDDRDIAVQAGHTDGGKLIATTYGQAERSSLERIKALDSANVIPISVASQSQTGGQSA